jgi:hypothetical protein
MVRAPEHQFPVDHGVAVVTDEHARKRRGFRRRFAGLQPAAAA